MPRETVVVGRQHDILITNFVVLTCTVAAMGGLLFGYDKGGATSRGIFLKKYFPATLRNESDHNAIHQSIYCPSGNPWVTFFTSSLYIAALIASIIASFVTRFYGRNISMCLAGFIYFIGGMMSACSLTLFMLVMGRIFLGIGIGFALQSCLIYLSEMSPPNVRGAFNQCFQMNITIGMVLANLVNYCTSEIKGGWGWRVSAGVAIIPALMLGVGSLFLPDTPNSLLLKGQTDKAKILLQNIRGASSHVEPEFQDLVFASEIAETVKNPWKKIVQSRYRPYLVMCIVIPICQQLCGINAITFYSPLIFKTLGLGEKAALMSSAVTGIVKAVATCVSIALVDTSGRRPLLIQGGIQMSICQLAISIMIWVKLGVSGHGSLTKNEGHYLLLFICFYVAGYAWSWGPLGWLIPSEICPLEIRSAAQSLNVSVNMLFTFAIAQSSLSMFCHLKFGMFILFAAFSVAMTAFVWFFLPETKNVPIECMNLVWKEHWFWGKYVPDDVVYDPAADDNRDLHSSGELTAVGNL